MVETYEVYFHGTSPPSGSPMAIGAVLVKGGQIFDKIGGVISYPGNPEIAQWEALVQGMILAKENNVTNAVFKGDSRYVINYMNGEPPRKEFTAMEHMMAAKKERLNFNLCYFQYVPPSKNNVAIDLAESSL